MSERKKKNPEIGGRREKTSERTDDWEKGVVGRRLRKIIHFFAYNRSSGGEVGRESPNRGIVKGLPTSGRV